MNVKILIYHQNLKINECEKNLKTYIQYLHIQNK